MLSFVYLNVIPQSLRNPPGIRQCKELRNSPVPFLEDNAIDIRDTIVKLERWGGETR